MQKLCNDPSPEKPKKEKNRKVTISSDERIVIPDDSPPKMPNPPRHQKIPVGMKNVGSSCWYNTVAQVSVYFIHNLFIGNSNFECTFSNET